MANQPGSSAVPSSTPSSAPSGNVSSQVTPPTQSKPEGKTNLPAQAKPPTEQADDTWEVQIDGKPVKKSRKEILEAYQLRQLSDRKRAEADKTLSEYNKLFETYKKDPIKFMAATGVDFEKMATSYLAKKAEEQMMDPKDRELKAAKAEAEQYKKWVEEQKAIQVKKEQEAVISEQRAKIHQEIIQAIEEAKEYGLPADEELVIAIAQKMLLQDKKQKPLDAKEALPKAYASTQKWLQGMASKMEGEALVKWLGTDVAAKIRKHDLAQLKAKRAQTAPQANSMVKPNSSAKKPDAKPYKTWSQFKAESLDTIQ